MKTKHAIYLAIFLQLAFFVALYTRPGQHYAQHEYSTNLIAQVTQSQESDQLSNSSLKSNSTKFSNFEKQSIRNSSRNLRTTTLKPSTTPLDESEKYRINTEGCKITNLPLFDHETRKIFLNRTELIWKCEKNLIDIKRFNETWLKFDLHGIDYKCFWRDLKRGEDDLHFDYGSFNGPIVDMEMNMGKHEFISIACFNNSKNSSEVLYENYLTNLEDIVYQQVIPLIPIKEKHTKSKVPNILLLAVDSTSYLNFKRHFIRTQMFMDKHNFFELKGYNKVGPNTFPNMVPFFTGLHVTDLVPEKDIGNIYFDDWPYVWKKYSDNGFVTQFVEEMPNYGLFNYYQYMKGFHKQPTDYQTRPWHMQLQADEYNWYCYKDKTEAEHSLDYTLDFIKAMRKRNQKYFAYISICELTHDWHNGAHYLDVPYLNFFQDIFDEQLNEDTIIFFFSDHGQRFGKLRETHSGEMENRLPFMFIHMPDFIPKEYLDNLRFNQDRLTTHFDTHATMVHLIEGKPNNSLKYGISLFEKINGSRTCNNSGIPESYCACNEDVIVENTEIINQNETISKLMTKLNSLMDSFRNKCEEFKFDSIKSIYNRTVSRDADEGVHDVSNVYLIQFYVNPGNALFETLLRSFDGDNSFEVISDLTRINQYGDQSNCIDSKLLKNYCFCKNKHT